MPLYGYRCPAAHLSEARRGYGDSVIPCPLCGAEAQRQPVYRIHIGSGPTTKFHLTEYQEAAAEANYYHKRMEQDRGHTIPRMPVVEMAKEQARKRGAKVKQKGI